jgi:hypothetical protein
MVWAKKIENDSNWTLIGDIINECMINEWSHGVWIRAKWKACVA